MGVGAGREWRVEEENKEISLAENSQLLAECMTLAKSMFHEALSVLPCDGRRPPRLWGVKEGGVCAISTSHDPE